MANVPKTHEGKKIKNADSVFTHHWLYVIMFFNTPDIFRFIEMLYRTNVTFKCQLSYVHMLPVTYVLKIRYDRLYQIDLNLTTWYFIISDIEAQVQEIQSRNKVDISEKDRIGLGESGFFDSEIYGGDQSRFDGYVTSIATNDEVEEEDYDGVATAGGRQSFTAPSAILNDLVGAEEDYDPFAEHRRPTIADREDEYRAKRRKMVISPERVDPFAEGRIFLY